VGLMLVEQPRTAVLSPAWWPVSPPVPTRERPARAEPPAAATSPVDIQPMWEALSAIPNKQAQSLGYDEWLSVVLAVHKATRADPQALEQLRVWSARSEKHTDEELDKQWHYANADKPGGVGLGTLFHLAGRYGWMRPEARPDADDFDVVHEAPAAPTTPATRRGVPQAKHLCTDQANANRLVAAYGSRVLVAAGRWHVWDGKRWLADEADVYRYACRLSAMVREEAKTVVRKAQEASAADGSAKRVEDAEAIAEALEKWSTRSEMKGTIEAAIGLARKMLTVDADSLDADPHLLNVRNGVVDLRTGALLPHDPARLMTKLADVDYVPDAQHDAWDRAVRAICGGDKPEAAALAGFLQRWFGYCATGLTREQVFVVHWGDGSNGKSTIMDTISRVLGDYAGTAPPGLVAGGERDRHPTEIASLLGKRMVTAHETREGVQLREDFVKQATGGDKLSARYMREDFFEFAPTHKLQLLTNSKPVVKGQDHGIWRRVRLVRYGQRFGTADEVLEGKATAIRDLHLADMLRGEEKSLQGVLAWIVKGAVEWFAGGLREPQAVIEAGEAYRLEQDRVRQWAMECCEVAPNAAEPLTLGMGGLFPSYTAWCREGGYHGLGRQRFLDEIVRAFPGIRTVEAYGRGDSGARRKITQVQGIRLLPE
jgi:putative DNA primase/helicase